MESDLMLRENSLLNLTGFIEVPFHLLRFDLNAIRLEDGGQRAPDNAESIEKIWVKIVDIERQYIGIEPLVLPVHLFPDSHRGVTQYSFAPEVLVRLFCQHSSFLCYV